MAAAMITLSSGKSFPRSDTASQSSSTELEASPNVSQDCTTEPSSPQQSAAEKFTRQLRDNLAPSADDRAPAASSH